MRAGMNRLASAFAGIVGLTVVTTAPADEVTAQVKPAVVLLSPRVAVYDAGLSRTSWSTTQTASALDNVREAWPGVVERTGHFTVIAEPYVSPDEAATLQQVESLVEALAVLHGGEHGRESIALLCNSFRTTLGSRLAFLRERSGAKFALGLLASQFEQTGTNVAVNTGLATAAMFFAPGAILPPMSVNHATAFLVDLQSGELAWINAHSGFEFAGIDSWDLRDAESTRKTLEKTLEDYPHAKSQDCSAPPPTAAVPLRLDPETMPRNGGFGIRPPKDWHVVHGRDELSATRDGSLLNGIHVNLDEHYHALPLTKRSTSNRMTTVELADAVVGEIRAGHPQALDILDVSTESTLAGRPAVRIHLRYRLPLAATDLTMEEIVVCTTLGRGLLSAQYTAPQAYFYDSARAEFEASVATVAERPYGSRR